MQARYEEARERYEAALPVYRQIGARLGEANTLLSLGRLNRATGDEAKARAALKQAADIYEAIGLEEWAQRARAEAE
jgi:tetratricopeptide (TPR) repeat protein